VHMIPPFPRRSCPRDRSLAPWIVGQGDVGPQH